jgi:hypothetical protein
VSVADALSHLLRLCPAADSGSSSLHGWIPAAALVAAAVALFGLFFNRASERRDRRRTLYSEAFQAAVGWAEMYYRVRRRDPEQPYAMAERFHSIQERIDFHQSWIASESVALGRAYCRLVLSIKALTYAEIKQAWESPPASPASGFSVAPVAAAELEAAKDLFIGDLRDHLSLAPWRRRALGNRYGDAAWQHIKAEI